MVLTRIAWAAIVTSASMVSYDFQVKCGIQFTLFRFWGLKCLLNIIQQIMKKLIVSFAFVLIALTLYAQSSSEHLTFKGVPIDGTLSEYVTKMKSAGFSHIGTKDGVALLSGEFAGYRDCMIGVETLKKQNTVYEIAVLFPTQNTWRGLSYDYTKLKSMLSKKYGEPGF